MDSASIENLPDSAPAAAAAASPSLPASVTVVDNLENLPPPPAVVIATVTSSHHSHDNQDVAHHHHHHHHADDHSLSASSPLPGPQREEPTLKEKLVDRERQRRKEAERARWKRQFALMSNGGGLVYDDNNNNNTNAAPVASSTVCAIGSMSITGTVGGEEEESSAHFNEDLHGGDEAKAGRTAEAPVPLGYTMERFLQEGGGGAKGTAASPASRPEAVTLTSAIIREEEQSLNDNRNNNSSNPQASSPDKGVVMERFLNEPVLVDVPVADLDVASPPSVGEPTRDADHRQESTSHLHMQGADNTDVHRSVSFDMELHQQSIPGRETSGNAPYDTSLHNMSSMADSMASVQVEVAPDELDTMQHELNDIPASPPSTTVSVPSVRAPSSLAMDDDRHDSMNRDRQSTSSPDRHHHDRASERMEGDDDDQPRVLRLTEAEIQEMASIEEASIGNAPPSDRDAESLVGELVGDFGTGTAGLGADAPSAGGSQGTPTTAMESGSMLSGGGGGGAARQAVLHHSRTPSDNTPPHHHLRMNIIDRDGDAAMSQQSMDDMIDDTIDDIPMSSSASVSSHLVVSPGASVSGSAQSVTANPPSEIAGGVDVGEGVGERIGVDDETVDIPAPIPVVVATSKSPDIERNIESSVDVAPSRSADSIEEGIRQELLATAGPSPEEITNRRIRPGIVRAPPESPLPDSVRRNIAGSNTAAANIDEFDFDKNDNPMTPNSRFSDSIRDLPEDDLWSSPGAKMSVSPMHSRGTHPYKNDSKQRSPLMLPETGPDGRVQQVHNLRDSGASPTIDSKLAAIQQPVLVDKLPSEMVTTKTATRKDRAFTEFHALNMTAVAEKDAEAYVGRNFLSRALPMRLVTLMATCFLEIPVFWMVVGNSDQLCRLLGKRQSQLLLAFVPIICATSGNLSLQSSTLTASAISHGQITPDNYSAWVGKEVAAAAFLGGGMALMLGTFAYYVSGATSTEFAFVIAIAQFLSATTSGCIGTLAPLVNSFLFDRNAGNWGGVLETVVPDIFSAFITAVLSYYILLLIGTPELSESQTCS